MEKQQQQQQQQQAVAVVEAAAAPATSGNEQHCSNSSKEQPALALQQHQAVQEGAAQDGVEWGGRLTRGFDKGIYILGLRGQPPTVRPRVRIACHGVEIVCGLEKSSRVNKDCFQGEKRA